MNTRNATSTPEIAETIMNCCRVAESPACCSLVSSVRRFRLVFFSSSLRLSVICFLRAVFSIALSLTLMAPLFSAACRSATRSASPRPKARSR